MNDGAASLVREMIKRKEQLGINVTKLKNKATLIDAGISANGGFEAGRLIGEICLRGPASMSIIPQSYGDLTMPSVAVTTDRPILSVLWSQLGTLGEFQAP